MKKLTGILFVLSLVSAIHFSVFSQFIPVRSGSYRTTLIVFSDSLVVSPEISNLEMGVYQCRLTANDGTYTSQSDVLIIVTDLANLVPYVSITTPANNSSYYEGKSVTLGVNATDLDGTISMVEYFSGDIKLGEALTAPFSIIWIGGNIASHSITAKATDNGGATAVSSPEIQPVFFTMEIQQEALSLELM